MCPYGSDRVMKRDGLTPFGGQRCRCSACRRTGTNRSGAPFAGHRWPPAVITTEVGIDKLRCKAQEVRPGYAARSYTWWSPPSTGRATIRSGAVGGASGVGAPGTGGTKPRLR
jgi:hypothetical protein